MYIQIWIEHVPSPTVWGKAWMDSSGFAMSIIESIRCSCLTPTPLFISLPCFPLWCYPTSLLRRILVACTTCHRFPPNHEFIAKQPAINHVMLMLYLTRGKNSSFLTSAQEEPKKTPSQLRIPTRELMMVSLTLGSSEFSK